MYQPFEDESNRIMLGYEDIYEEIIHAQRLLLYIILSNYVRSILFCRDKHRHISQTWFHVCTKMHYRKKHVCERKTLFGQPNV